MDDQAGGNAVGDGVIRVDEDCACFGTFKFEAGGDAPTLQRPQFKSKPPPPADAEPGSKDRPGGHSKLDDLMFGSARRESLEASVGTPLDIVKEPFTREDGDGSSPMKLLLRESNAYIKQRIAARVIRRCEKTPCCNRLCAGLCANPLPWEVGGLKAKAYAAVTLLRGTLPPKLTGSHINTNPWRWVKRDGKLHHKWRPAFRPATVTRHVAAIPDTIPPNETHEAMQHDVDHPPVHLETTNNLQPPARSRHHRAELPALTEPDVFRFLDVLTLAGIHDKTSDWESWWSTDPILVFPAVRKLCTKQEFMFVLRHVHLADSVFDYNKDGNAWSWVPKRGSGERDRARKVRTWKKLLNENFQSTHEIGRDLSYNEAVVASVARHAFRVFMKDQPVRVLHCCHFHVSSVDGRSTSCDVSCSCSCLPRTHAHTLSSFFMPMPVTVLATPLRTPHLQVKRGFKQWVTRDAISRCCFQANLYHGDRDKEAGHDPGVLSNLGALAYTVYDELRLANLLNEGHHFVADRAFLNIPTTHALRRANTTVTGTVQSNRKGIDCDDFILDGNERGAAEFGHTKVERDKAAANKPDSHTVCFTRWMDSKPVNFLSTEVGVGHGLGNDTTKRQT